MYCVISSFFSNFKFRNLLILLLIFVFLLNKSAISDEEKLKNIILLQNGLINISKLENTDYVKSSSDLIKNTYNTKKMIRMIIGEKWNRFSEDQQEKIHLVFRKYIALNYIKRFKKIKKPTFQINGKRKIGDKLYALSPLKNKSIQVEIVSSHYVDSKGERVRS